MTSQQRIAVLGGGVAGLSTAFYLTQTEELRARYHVSIHQMGWRLGGKGRTGRNSRAGLRAEEHGYHLLFGFYENVFSMLRGCYDELHAQGLFQDVMLLPERAADEGRDGVTFAFHRQNVWRMWSDQPDGRWHQLAIEFTANDLLPGDGGATPFEEGGVVAALTFARFLLRELLRSFGDERRSPGHRMLKGAVGSLARTLDRTIRLVGRFGRHRPERPRSAREREALLRRLDRILEMALRVLWRALGRFAPRSWAPYVLWVAMDFVLTTARGLIADGGFEGRLDEVSCETFHDWFSRHATVPQGSALTLSSFWMQVAYDASFAYLGGDSVTEPAPAEGHPLFGHPDMDAATMIRGMLRMMLTYKGALAWQFQAGCGEIIVTPLYECLRRRGVDFRFFEHVDELALGIEAGQLVIEGVRVLDQVPLREGVERYEPPLLDTGFPIPGWGSEPDWSQLAPSNEGSRPNFECPFEPWPDARPRWLRRGVDFDHLVLAIPVGALRQLCEPLAERLPAWRRMLDGARTVRTGGVQLWLDRPAQEYSASMRSDAQNIGRYPLETWADMSHLTATERAASGDGPAGMLMICGAIADDPDEPTGPRAGYLESQERALREETARMLDQRVAHVLPTLVGADGFGWSRLHAPAGVEGRDRLAHQYFSPNVSPADRYVMSPAGHLVHRLAPDQSGVANLTLAGDWTRSGLDAGCMEGTVMSAMAASRAICGHPAVIPYERFLRPPRQPSRPPPLRFTAAPSPGWAR